VFIVWTLTNTNNYSALQMRLLLLLIIIIIIINYLCLCHHWKMVSDAFYIQFCPSVSASLCVPTTLWMPYLKIQWREFYPIFATDVFGFFDVLVKFWSPKVKVTAGSDPKNRVKTIC